MMMPPIALVRWLSRMHAAGAPNDTSSDFRPLPAFVNRMLKRVAALELSASRHLSLPFGTSVFAIARKHDDPRPYLSIVVPLYNAAANLPALHQEISALQIEGGHELILVNDGSRDGTEAVALKLTRESQLPMTFLSLSRNFGEHNAVLAGLRAASGRYAVTMDDDLQNPPSEVLKLLAAAEAEKARRRLRHLRSPRTSLVAQCGELAQPMSSPISWWKSRGNFTCAASVASAVSWSTRW